MRRINRSYRILGLPPGSSQEDIKRAYRDLAQVWHPDRFAHNPRLQKKAQENLKRINEAFETLRSHSPSGETADPSWLSDSFSSIIGIGDMLKTGSFRTHAPSQQRRRVVVFGETDDSSSRRRSRSDQKRSRRQVLFFASAIALLAAAVVGVFLLV